jgi:hypothetical protein
VRGTEGVGLDGASNFGPRTRINWISTHIAPIICEAETFFWSKNGGEPKIKLTHVNNIAFGEDRIITSLQNESEKKKKKSSAQGYSNKERLRVHKMCIKKIKKTFQ